MIDDILQNYRIVFKNNKKIKYFFLFSIIFHLIASYFSIGFFKYDEHFSILEAVNYKLNKDATLGWDFFQYYDRSWLLPFIYFIITKFLLFFSIDNPFVWAFFYRLFSAFLGIISLFCIIYFAIKIFKKSLSIYIASIISTTFWFYPFFHVRTSSENISVSLLLIGITIFFLKKNSFTNLIFFISGFVIGLAFIARFSLGVSILGFGIWALLINRDNFINLISTALGIIFAIIIGVIIDYWGYGSIQFTPYNYYIFNGIILMNYFDSFPWWYYFYIILNQFLPPISVLILISIIVFWLRKPLSFITWITLPSFIFLSTIPWKEIRLLFPILVFSPIYIASLFEYFSINKKFFNSFFLIRFLKFFLAIFIIINFLALVVLSFIPANNGVGLFKFLYKNSKEINQIYTLDGIPFKKGDLLNNFYRHKNSNFISIMEKEQCNESFFQKFKVETHNLENKIKYNEIIEFPEVQVFSTPKWIYKYKIFCNKDDFKNKLKLKNNINYFLFSNIDSINLFENYENNKCDLIYSTVPQWILSYNYNNWLSRSSNWYLVRCERS